MQYSPSLLNYHKRPAVDAMAAERTHHASSDFTCDVDYPGNVGSKSCLGSVSHGWATGIQR